MVRFIRCLTATGVGARVDKVASVTDVSNFDIYPADNTEPPDDLSGWDKDF